MKGYTNDFIAVLVVFLVCLMFAVIAIEWVAGCGESYVDAAGERHIYQCVFLKTKE